MIRPYSEVVITPIFFRAFVQENAFIGWGLTVSKRTMGSLNTEQQGIVRYFLCIVNTNNLHIDFYMFRFVNNLDRSSLSMVLLDCCA
jgi:hypothetical protein